MSMPDAALVEGSVAHATSARSLSSPTQLALYQFDTGPYHFDRV